MTPRAITGFGVVSSIGIGRDAFLTAVRAGARFDGDDGRVETFDASAYPGARVAEVRGFDSTTYLGDKGLRTLDRLTKLLIVSARLALHDAGLKREGAWVRAAPSRPGPDHVGLVCSNAYGSLEAITELDRVAILEDARYINPSRFPLTVSNSAAGYVSIWEDLRAVNVTVSDGNCGALDAVACADALLDQGRADVLLVGGAEAMSEALFLGFHRLGAAGSRRPRGGLPSTDGPCLGEGAALVALEPGGSARARSASILAEVVGFGTSFAPPQRAGLLFHASPAALEEAIRAALSDAGVTPSQVDLVVSGVSGLRAFDEAELLAIERTVPAEVPVVAPKLALGETLGAGGAMGMLTAIAHLRARPLDRRDAGPALQGGALRAAIVRGDPMRDGLRGGGKLRIALITALGYYGNASALVLCAASS